MSRSYRRSVVALTIHCPCRTLHVVNVVFSHSDTGGSHKAFVENHPSMIMCRGAKYKNSRAHGVKDFSGGKQSLAGGTIITSKQLQGKKHIQGP